MARAFGSAVSGPGDRLQVPHQGARDGHAESRGLLGRGNQRLERAASVAGVQREQAARQHGNGGRAVGLRQDGFGRHGGEQDRLGHAAAGAGLRRAVGEAGATRAQAGARGVGHGQGEADRHGRIRRRAAQRQHIAPGDRRVRLVCHHPADEPADRAWRGAADVDATAAEELVLDVVYGAAAGHHGAEGEGQPGAQPSSHRHALVQPSCGRPALAAAGCHNRLRPARQRPIMAGQPSRRLSPPEPPVS